MRNLFRFLRAREGLAAVEFALLAPLMVLLLFGSIEITNLLHANRRVENTTSSLADVISRDTVISDAEMAATWTAVPTLMFPDTGAMDVRITSIRIVSTTEARVVWCERQGGSFANLAPDSLVAGLPGGMMTPGTSIIRVETRYTHQPPLGFFFMQPDTRNLVRDDAARTINHVAFRRSRLIDPITRSVN